MMYLIIAVWFAYGGIALNLLEQWHRSHLMKRINDAHGHIMLNTNLLDCEVDFAVSPVFYYMTRHLRKIVLRSNESTIHRVMRTVLNTISYVIDAMIWPVGMIRMELLYEDKRNELDELIKRTNVIMD